MKTLLLILALLAELLLAAGYHSLTNEDLDVDVGDDYDIGKRTGPIKMKYECGCDGNIICEEIEDNSNLINSHRYKMKMKKNVLCERCYTRDGEPVSNASVETSTYILERRGPYSVVPKEIKLHQGCQACERTMKILRSKSELFDN